MVGERLPARAMGTSRAGGDGACPVPAGPSLERVVWDPSLMTAHRTGLGS